MKGRDLIWLLAIAGGLAALGVAGVQTGIISNPFWKSAGAGSTWLPVLNAAEDSYGIPRDLLARQAYQESHFRQDIIDGSTASPAGALGILQLMPAYFPVVNTARPYSAADTANQIAVAAAQMASLYNQFGDWGLALAAYNDGAGNVNSYLAGTRALPDETVNYVSAILADVPIPGATMVT